jgi:hypothetical protein
MPALESSDDAAGRDLIREEEERMEEKVFRIWSVLSTFEESSAACISDMLLHVSNGSYVEGVFVAKRFIYHVEILFQSADRLDATMVGLNEKGKHPLALNGVALDLTFSQACLMGEKPNYYAKRSSPFSLYFQRRKTALSTRLVSHRSFCLLLPASLIILNFLLEYVFKVRYAWSAKPVLQTAYTSFLTT